MFGRFGYELFSGSLNIFSQGAYGPLHPCSLYRSVATLSKYKMVLEVCIQGCRGRQSPAKKSLISPIPGGEDRFLRKRGWEDGAQKSIHGMG